MAIQELYHLSLLYRKIQFICSLFNVSTAKII